MSKITNKFSINGAYVHPYKETEGSVTEKIPAGLYSVRFSSFVGYYLELVSTKITLPEKVYGSTVARSNRAFNHYNRVTTGLCMGLFGLKGAGKTLLANYMAQEWIDKGLPVIDVSDSFKADKNYYDFINSLGEVFIIFDEFLKKLSIHETDERQKTQSGEIAKLNQDSMLTFLQGTNNVPRFTVLIDNDSYHLSDFIKNRPGRMRYLYNYDNIEPAVVEEMSSDFGLTSQQSEALIVYSQNKTVSFDMIKTIIEEWVTYPNEDLEDITKVLNVPDLYKTSARKVSLEIKGDIPNGIKVETGSIGSLTGDTYLSFTAKIPNQFYSKTPMTEKEFSDNKDEVKDIYDSYKEYLEQAHIEYTETNMSLSSGALKGYTVGYRAYTWGEATVIATLLEDIDSVKASSSYFNDLDSDFYISSPSFLQ